MQNIFYVCYENMDFSISKFAKPILARSQDLDRQIYSEQEWTRMLGYKEDGPFDATISTKLYVNAMQDTNTNRKVMYSTSHVPTKTNLSHQSHSEPKAIAAMASWCGFSKKAYAKIFPKEKPPISVKMHTKMIKIKESLQFLQVIMVKVLLMLQRY